ncbi:HDOD domain-containing protein [Vibrio sp. JC009]|uniref:HDOD domain-containing protein n=1 Tax=Vibrio sp. JC009 TaxID=2912314 RepID=UPI0023B0099E|nr:HDOD domain-containing protein [Vibrio sp. JC009]WED23001.1 HDOD domain-containing protein [Vibrio sp. JC009]
MNHLSFYWLPGNKNQLIEALESEFAVLVEQSIQTGKISLPPIPEVVLKIQRLCAEEGTGIPDIAECLIDDPSLAAVVIRVANSVIFNRRNITCTDLQTAVSRLGMMRVRDIVTAQAIEQLKHSANLDKECNEILINSAATSRELAATMVLVTEQIKQLSDGEYEYLELEKSLLVGLLADIGLFCLVSEYHHYLDKGNYLEYDLALQIFNSRCPVTSELVLKHWQFDTDFLEVATNNEIYDNRPEISYLDIARIANHLLMFRRNDEAIDDHHVEINAVGAEALYELSNMEEPIFKAKVSDIIQASGL